MGGRSALFLFLFAITVIIGFRTEAAEIKCVHAMRPTNDMLEYARSKGRALPAGGCLAFSIRGAIVNGDYDHFRALLRSSHPLTTTVYISSPGGNVFEAIRIGRLIRQTLLETWAPSRGVRGGFLLTSNLPVCEGQDCLCASACFLIWAAGIHQMGDFIGVHRPRTSDSYYGALSATEAATLHANIMREVSAYFDALGLPRKYQDLMERTNSADMHWLTPEDVEADFDGYIPAIAEWLRGNCGAVSRTERDRFTWLSYRVFYQQPSRQERAEFEALLRRNNDISTCESRKLFESRYAITIN